MRLHVVVVVSLLVVARDDVDVRCVGAVQPSSFDRADEAQEGEAHYPNAHVKETLNVRVAELEKRGPANRPEVSECADNAGHDADRIRLQEGNESEGRSLTTLHEDGEDNEHADIVVSPYPSDHRAVVATFTLTETSK